MKSEDPRIKSILAAITKIAAGNLDTRIEISDALDEIDGIATGINMLAEEINGRLVQHEDENRQLNETIAQLKAVRARLSDSENLFSQVFQTSPDGISISKMDTGEFVEVNRSFEKLTGYTRDELIGKSVYAVGLWSDEHAREKIAASLRQGLVDAPEEKQLLLRELVRSIETYNAPENWSLDI